MAFPPFTPPYSMAYGAQNYVNPPPYPSFNPYYYTNPPAGLVLYTSTFGLAGMVPIHFIGYKIPNSP